MKEQTALQKQSIDPQALITKALESGANIEVLERLVALSERVRESSAKEDFQTAFVNFQSECAAIKKNKTAKIYSAKGSYSYKYADLDEICQTVKPVMKKYGLSYSWSAPRTDSTHAVVSCTVAHIHGHKESSGEVAMPFGDGSNPAQRVAIAITYARRYSLTGILGIAPEDDTDAQGSETEKRNHAQPEPAAAELSATHATLYDDTEVELAKKALELLMQNPRFSEAQREVAKEWLAKPGNADVKKIRAKMRAQQVWLEDVQKWPQNQDADPPAVAEGQAF